MSDETIFATLPKISEETKRLVERQLAHYIWYEGNGARNRREYHCSCCHETWRHDELRTITPRDYNLRRADHGEEVVCPRCGEDAKLMCVGKIRSGWRYSQAYGVSIVAAVAGNPNEVWIRTFRVSVNYGSYGWGFYYKAKPEWEEKSRHRMVPGQADYWDKDYYDTGMRHATKIKDYFGNKNWRDAVEGDCAKMILFQTPREDTFLRYCAWNEYRRKYDTSPAMYLCACAVHPQIEMMVKMGYNDVVRDLIMRGKKNARCVNWEADRPADIFRMSKADFSEWQRRGGDFRMRKIFETYRGHGKRWSVTQEEYDVTEKTYFMREDWIKKSARAAGRDFHSAYTYLQRQAGEGLLGSVFYKWKDYYHAAKKIGIKLIEPKRLFPENLQAAHDEMMQLKALYEGGEEIKRQSIHQEGLEKHLPKYRRKYTASDGVYMIRVPETTKEIVIEGQTLDHCVGRMEYIRRMAEGKNAIVFLRRCAEPDTPWYTIEVSPKKVVQCEGAKRHDGKDVCYGHLYRDDLPEDAKAFLDTWEAKVCRGETKSRKTKRAG